MPGSLSEGAKGLLRDLQGVKDSRFRLQVVLAREAASAIQESDAKNRVMSLPSTHRANAGAYRRSCFRHTVSWCFHLWASQPRITLRMH